jgi:flagellar basal body-associated protein FliL
MDKKDLINEYIGIVAIIVIVALAVIAIYFYVKHQPADAVKEMDNATITFISSTNTKALT